MKNIFQIDERFHSQEDKILKYVKEITSRDFSFPSGLIFLEYQELEYDLKGSIKKLQDPKNQTWGILQVEVSMMFQELGRLLRLFEGFYLGNLDGSDSQNLSPQKINYLINRTLIRIKRLVCVLDPDYSKIKFQDKKSDNHYTMIKGYWINDEGKRERSMSRNIGNTEYSFKELTEKLFKLNMKNIVVFEPESIFRWNPDMIVSDGKNKWVVEFKLQNMDNFIKAFVMFEMWKMYKEEYELMND
jgi:hypothetical protein